jgi:membrane protein required for beta-lactamase induction
LVHLPDFADFDYYFLFVGWWQWAVSLVALTLGIYRSSLLPALLLVLVLFKITLLLIVLSLFLANLPLFLIVIFLFVGWWQYAAAAAHCHHPTKRK